MKKKKNFMQYNHENYAMRKKIGRIDAAPRRGTYNVRTG